YNPAPVSIENMTEGSEGVVPEASLSIGNASLFMSRLAAFKGVNGLVGRRVTLLRVHSSHLDVSTAKIQIRFWVKSASVSEGSQSIRLQLGLDDLLNAKVPIEFLSRVRCRFQYRGAFCGY